VGDRADALITQPESIDAGVTPDRALGRMLDATTVGLRVVHGGGWRHPNGLIGQPEYGAGDAIAEQR
jgi:hypothetical protein